MATKINLSEMDYDYFEGQEHEKRKQLIELMNDWKKVISNKDKILFNDDGEEHDAISYFGSDGFFPGYFNQEIKVLFIGREARDNSNGDLVVKMLQEFEEKSYITKSIFWRRLIYILYGIITKENYVYEDIPNIVEIIDELKNQSKLGFAFMNVSKYSNDREDGATSDFKLINRFLVDSELNKRNFIKEEIEILNPDVIVTANLWDGNISLDILELCFPNKKLVSTIDDKANLYNFSLNGREIKLIDLWHFSKPGSDKDKYYDPVVELLFKN